MRNQKTPEDHIFDGFMHRPYDPTTDAWKNVLPNSSDYPVVQFAEQILDMFSEIKQLRTENWQLKRTLAEEQRIGGQYTGVKHITEIVFCSKCKNYHRKEYTGSCDNKDETFANVYDAEFQLATPVLEVAKD